MLAIGTVIALLVLPSALTTPQANPSTELELAPVPPNTKTPPLQTGNLSTLALGNLSTGLGAGAGGGGAPTTTTLPSLLPPLGAVTGVGSSPIEKDCVGNPPRQTEDPLSPPCVGYFQGNNDGATYQGVTGSTIRIVLYYNTGTYQVGNSVYVAPVNTIINLDQTPYQPGEFPYLTVDRAWERYFNSRYQTYNRHIAFYLQFESYDANSNRTTATREADAAAVYDEVRPFAVLNENQLNQDADQSYLDYMAQHGVLSFGSGPEVQSDELYQRYPGLEWSYQATLEQLDRNFDAYVCQKVVGQPTDDGGAGVGDGQPRKFGLIETTDPAFPSYQHAAQQVASAIEGCGVKIADTATYAYNGETIDERTTPEYAIDAMSRFAADKITTILWPIGMETKFSAEAETLHYDPEWVLGGDPEQAWIDTGQFQNQSEWSHAWTITSDVYYPRLASNEVCYEAYRTVDIQASNDDVQLLACPQYNDLRQLFTGIQVAGPILGRYSVDEGFHAIPDKPSTSIEEPACYYLANDYTCVKDATVEWWDATESSSQSDEPGCWRMIDRGQRFDNQQFPPGNLAAQQVPADDQCNNDTGTESIAG